MSGGHVPSRWAAAAKSRDLRGKWENFVITTVAQPLPGVERALVIVGSDKRGTIYGIYELSEQLGVSPWNWINHRHGDIVP